MKAVGPHDPFRDRAAPTLIGPGKVALIDEHSVMLNEDGVRVRELTGLDVLTQPIERFNVETGCRGVPNDPVLTFRGVVRGLGSGASDEEKRSEPGYGRSMAPIGYHGSPLAWLVESGFCLTIRIVSTL
jgi:hypothetical protein